MKTIRFFTAAAVLMMVSPTPGRGEDQVQRVVGECLGPCGQLSQEAPAKQGSFLCPGPVVESSGICREVVDRPGKVDVPTVASTTGSSPLGEGEPASPVPQLRANPDCLAAYYEFSDVDAASGVVRDQSGNGFDLAPIGQRPTLVDGVEGKAAALDGGHFQAMGNPLEGADHLTVSLWFKTAEPMNNYKLAAAAVWSGGNNASGWNIGTHYSEFWSDHQKGSLRGEPGWTRSIGFRKGEWNHLVVTYDGAVVREYINGVPSARIRGTGLRLGNGVPVTVGSWGGGFSFNGLLDEVRIYRRALGEEEVQALCKASGGSNP